MYIAPNSTVKFYSDIPIVTGRQIAFSTKAKQTAYFNSKQIATYTPTTYVRPNEILKVDSAIVPYTTAMRINYLSFVNPDFENITWYAKVTSTNYTNNGCVEMTFALDLFQTFMNDIDFDTCIMEREQLSVSDYDKSVANPYDYDIIELQTDEDIPLPNSAYDFPAITGRNGVYGPKRTHLPGGYEDSSAEKTADNTMMYTIIMSCPISSFTPNNKASLNKEIKLPFGLKVNVPDFFTSYEGTFPETAMEGIFYEAGYFNARRQESGTSGNTGRDRLPIPSSKPANKRTRNIKSLGSNGVIDGYGSGTATLPIIGTSWVSWPYKSGNIDSDGNNCGYDAGFGMFGLKQNNVNNQVLILATSNYNKMCNILNTITENDAVSSITGCYMLPLSFLTMIHASAWNNEISVSYSPLFSGNEPPTNSSYCPPDGNSLDVSYNEITLYTENVKPLDFNQVKNKKLLTFPYQYIRVSDPSGLKKEYKFEDFPKLQDVNSGNENDFNVQFTLLADLVSGPKLEMYPYLYKIVENAENTKMSFRKKLNVEERMEYTEIPQQAYMTDAFTSYVANQYAQESLVNTTNKLWSSQEGVEGSVSALSGYAKQAAGEKRGLVGGILEFFGLDNSANLSILASPITDNRYVNGMTDRAAGKYASTTMGSYSMNGVSAVSGAAAALQTGGRIGSNIVNTFGPGSAERRTMEADQMAASAENAIAEKRIRSAALNWCDGTYKVSPYLDAAKGAFRVNNYNAGTGSGILPYFLGGFKFTFDVMKLKPEFLAKYDEYFTNYGYNSTRVGIPHIQSYLQGTKTGNAPKFLENADGYYVTYIKTISCKVNHYNRMIASFIEGLFDGGIQLIDGDTLL